VNTGRAGNTRISEFRLLHPLPLLYHPVMSHSQNNGTAFFYHPVFQKHKTGWKHPEKQNRLTAILGGLKQAGVWELLQHPAILPATVADLTAIHDPQYVNHIRQACEAGGLFEPDDVTIGSPDTYEAALMAAGAVLAAVDAVMAGHAPNAFCAVRPPGHHAERDRAMGFCFFNNVAIGAKHLQQHHGIQRVAIIDWDVHHGNGTQQAFYDDPSVLYFSIHQHPLYPQSGQADEIGIGKGKGFTLNYPVSAGSTDTDYLRIFKDYLRPALAHFSPEFILISSGFDAHHADPLAGMALTEKGFEDLTRLVTAMASEYCEKRLVSVLEGGYDVKALAACVVAHIKVLLESS
jgi:acetoin utilization deacetylase AcuC-like enzyme